MSTVGKRSTIFKLGQDLSSSMNFACGVLTERAPPIAITSGKPTDRVPKPRSLSEKNEKLTCSLPGRCISLDRLSTHSDIPQKWKGIALRD